MTRIVDRADLGFLVLQDHEEGVPIETRMTLAGARIERARDISLGSSAKDSLIVVASEQGKGTLGDLHPWFFWQTTAREQRGMGSWAQSFPSMVTSGVEGGFGKGGTGRKVANPKLSPIQTFDYLSDVRYSPVEPVLPASFPIPPKGYLMSMHGGTEETYQGAIALYTDPRMFAPWAEGPAECGSLVVDLQPNGEPCMDFADHPGEKGRHARLQSLVRVIAVDDKGIPELGVPGKLNWLALNYTASGQDQLAGYGLVFGRLEKGGGPNIRSTGPITKQPPASGDFIRRIDKAAKDWQGGSGPQAMAASLGSGSGNGNGSSNGRIQTLKHGLSPDETGHFEAKQEYRAGIAMMAHADAWGPLCLGSKDDKHEIAMDRDGHVINSGHISVDAYIFRNSTEDGPFLFEGTYIKPPPYPLRSDVHLEWDGKLAHGFLKGARFGKWRWRAEVPYVGSDEPPTIQPPVITPGDSQPPTPGSPGTPFTPSPGRGTPPTPGSGGPVITPSGGGPSTPSPGTGAGPVITPGTGGPPTPLPGGGGAHGDGRRPVVTPSGGGPAPPLPGTGGRQGHRDPVVTPGGPAAPQPGNGGGTDPKPPTHDELIRILSQGALGGPPLDNPKPKSTTSRYIDRVGQMDSEDRGLYGVHFPCETTFAQIGFRPELMILDRPSFRHNPRANPDLIREEERSRPTVLTALVWGAQGNGGEWDYAARPEVSRVRGGAANGGILFAQPGLALEDFLGINSQRDVTTIATASFITCAPGTAFALGTPALNGSLNASGVVIAQDPTDTTNNPLVIYALSSSGGPSKLFYGKHHQSSGEVVVEVGTGGNQAVRVPKGTTAQRQSSIAATGGEMRFNSDIVGGVDTPEYYDSQTEAWKQFGPRATVTFTGTGTYTYEHGFGQQPNVQVLDSNGHRIEPCVRHTDVNTVVLHFVGTITDGVLILS